MGYESSSKKSSSCSCTQHTSDSCTASFISITIASSSSSNEASASDPGGSSSTSTSTPCVDSEQLKEAEKKREKNRQYRQKYNVRDVYPRGKKCEDRFVFYSFHFDGVCTSFWGTGTTFEVVSLQILNTPDVNRADRRFCCFVGVFKKDKGTKGAIQQYIPAFHTILQEIVVSGLVGRYYLHDGVYYHVRWAILGLSGDSKAHEELIGCPGKQMSNRPSLYSDLRKVVINPITCWYDMPGKYITPKGSLLSSTESVWNTLDPCSFSRFWNIISCNDKSGLKILEDMSDAKGKREVVMMKMLNAFIRGDRGWKPVPFPEEISVAMLLNTIMKADAVLKEKTNSFPSLSTALEHFQTEKQKEKQVYRPKITTLKDYMSDTMKVVLEEKEKEKMEVWKELLRYPRQDVDNPDYQRLFEKCVYNVMNKGCSLAYTPLDDHLPLLPGHSCIIDMMHLVGNAVKHLLGFLGNSMGKAQKTLYLSGFDSFVSLERGDFAAGASCFKVDSVFLNAAMQRMNEYQRKHPKYIPWFRPGMLSPDNMTDLKTVYKCHIAFGIAHFAFQDFWNESPVFEVLAAFDGLSFFFNAYRDVKEAARVQARLSFFVGKLCNMLSPGCECPTITTMASLFHSLLFGGPLSYFCNFGAEGSYRFVTANYLAGRNPCSTLFHRLHALMTCRLFLFWKDLPFDKATTTGEIIDLQSSLLAGLPEWIPSIWFANRNYQDDYRYYLDDSLVYDDVFYHMLESNDNPMNLVAETSDRVLPDVVFTHQTALLSSITWNGTVYKSAHSIDPVLYPITVDNLENAKECIAFTVDRKGQLVFLLIVGYYLSFAGEMSFPEAVGIVIPTFCFSLVAPWCHRAFVDRYSPVIKEQCYKFVRVSLNRIHIDTAIPFPFTGNNLMLYTGCLFVRPERSIPSSQLFFPPIDNKYRVSARRSEKRSGKSMTVDSPKEELLKRIEDLSSIIDTQAARIKALESMVKKK